MGNNLKNVIVSTVVGALTCGLLVNNLNAITASTTYGTVSTAVIAAETQQVTVKARTVTTSPTSKDAEAHAEPATPKVTMSLDAWLEKLAEKESGNRARIKVLDVNGRYSYGCLQFQMATFKSYSARYGLVDPSTVADWEELLYDCSLQKRIAKRMIQEKSSNWRHWGYTVLQKGVGLPPTQVGLSTAQ